MDFLTSKQIREMFKISKATFYNHLEEGSSNYPNLNRIPLIYVDRRRMFSKKAAEALLKERESELYESK